MEQSTNFLKASPEFYELRLDPTGKGLDSRPPIAQNILDFLYEVGTTPEDPDREVAAHAHNYICALESRIMALHTQLLRAESWTLLGTKDTFTVSESERALLSIPPVKPVIPLMPVLPEPLAGVSGSVEPTFENRHTPDGGIVWTNPNKPEQPDITEFDGRPGAL